MFSLCAGFCPSQFVFARVGRISATRNRSIFLRIARGFEHPAVRCVRFAMPVNLACPRASLAFSLSPLLPPLPPIRAPPCCQSVCPKPEELVADSPRKFPAMSHLSGAEGDLAIPQQTGAAPHGLGSRPAALFASQYRWGCWPWAALFDRTADGARSHCANCTSPLVSVLDQEVKRTRPARCWPAGYRIIVLRPAAVEYLLISS
jgi:hypothetical protein